MSPQPGAIRSRQRRSRQAFRAPKLSKEGMGHQKVPTHVAHYALDLAFVIAPAGTAEPVIEQVVGLELGEGAGPLAAAIAQVS